MAVLGRERFTIAPADSGKLLSRLAALAAAVTNALPGASWPTSPRCTEYSPGSATSGCA